MTAADACTPPLTIARRVSDELAPQRARLLRTAAIAHRRAVLDLGSGHGVVLPELRRRAAGPVVALDRRPRPEGEPGDWITADARAMPFPAGTFDLIFAQQFFVWVEDLSAVLTEIERVLARGGVLAALEPEYGGMIEQPPSIAIADVWRASLQRAGARIDAGAALVSALGSRGWAVEVQLATGFAPADPDRYDRLEGLPLEPGERARLGAAAAADRVLPAAAKVVHLPYVGVLARR